MNVPTFTATLTLIAVFVCPLAVQAQGQFVTPAPFFGSGPSDSNLFDTVIDLPADQASIAGTFGDASGGTFTQLNVQDSGTVDAGSFADVSEVNISGGTVGDSFQVALSEVNISGGSVGDGFFAVLGSEVNISGGTVGDGFTALFGTVVNISGGTVGDDFDVVGGSVLNISGGAIGSDFTVGSDDELNLFGTEFFLDDIQLTSLVLGQSFTVDDRGGSILSGTLVDGSAFDFALSDGTSINSDFFPSGSTVTVTLANAIPEPNSVVLLLSTGVGLLGRRRRSAT